METFLQNDQLEIVIKHKGAELCSIKNKVTGLQYMWSGDVAVWGKTSPVLFPIVGALKENVFYVDNQKYELPRHGFARDRIFELVEHSDDKAVFALRSDDASRKIYPFDFEFRIIYTLHQAMLHATYSVSNSGDQEMLFSLGAHPAFKVPLVQGGGYDDYFLVFDETETANRWPIDGAGLIMNQPMSLLVNTNKLPLSKTLFDHDALVLKKLKSTKVSLRSLTHAHGLDFYFDGFPYLGIWAAKNADFVCIEPWCGIADGVDHDQQLRRKEGIEKLEAGRTWNRTWKASFY